MKCVFVRHKTKKMSSLVHIPKQICADWLQFVCRVWLVIIPFPYMLMWKFYEIEFFSGPCPCQLFVVLSLYTYITVYLWCFFELPKRQWQLNSKGFLEKVNLYRHKTSSPVKLSEYKRNTTFPFGVTLRVFMQRWLCKPDGVDQSQL